LRGDILINASQNPAVLLEDVLTATLRPTLLEDLRGASLRNNRLILPILAKLVGGFCGAGEEGLVLEGQENWNGGRGRPLEEFLERGQLVLGRNKGRGESFKSSGCKKKKGPGQL